MTIKIYTVHHAVPHWYMANEVFQPFIVGAAAEAPDLPAAFQTDLEEPTLHGKILNESLAEMRCHYWVFKHPPGTAYVGFQHYRRTLVSTLTESRFAEIRVSAHDFMNRDLALTTSWIKGLPSHYDIIVPRKWPAQPDLGADYARSHSAADWQVLLGAMQHPEMAQGIDYIYRANMFVMRADLFAEYMTWWSLIIGRVAELIRPPAEGYQSRTFGFMSERLFTMWVARLHREAPVRILELPLMFGNFTAI